MKRFLTLMLLALVMMTVIVGCAQAPKELKIGILAPLSGGQPTFGVSTQEGALLAIKEWNAKGGVLNRQIKAIVEDSQCEADPAVNAANKLINQDKVKYLIGEVCSKASIPVSEIATAAKVIQVTGTSTNTAVTIDKNGKAKPYVFRACFIDPFQGKVGATFAFKNLNAKKAFLMLDQSNDYVKGLSEAFETTFKELGGEIVGKESYTSADKDFSAILAKVKAAKPDVIYLPDYYQVINLATKQASEKGIKVPFMGGDGWDSGDLDKKAAAGGYYTNHYFPGDQRPEVQNFLAAYGADYKNEKGEAKIPDALAALAYDATNLVLQGIKDAGKDDTTAVNAALEKINFKAISGTITFDAQHNPIKGAVILKVLKDKIAYETFVQP
jgi:branched-chain amino acid transport system substrate-binding protein